MREILFRGKRLDNGEWAVGYLEKCPSAIQMPGYGGPWYIRVPPQNPDDNGGFYNIDPETVGEYTGKKDKTENRIFEGDIVRAETYHDCGQYGEKGWATYAVKWDEKRAMFYPFNIVDGDYLRLETFEIIGNIYDNPELMEVT